jgi:hypothetical protein
MIENATVRAERERLEQEWLEGADEGYHANVNTLPPWWFLLAPGDMTRRQRGYFFGRELRLSEAANE